MTQAIFSPSDLSERTREILDRVQDGELAIVASDGEERIVLLDALDYRLLRALALCATGAATGEDLPEAQVIRDYLDERINLGKAAELLQVTRFELEDSFRRLGAPLRLGVSSVEDAQAEMAVMEERLDVEDARAARSEAQEKGTIPLAVLKRELETSERGLRGDCRL